LDSHVKEFNRGKDIQMNINDYQYVVTTAQLGSYNAAAKELFITQPSLSQRIKYIEMQYGVKLFIRSKQGVVLTHEGEIFVRYAKKILDMETALREEYQLDVARKEQTVKFGITWIIDSPYFSMLVTNILRAHPQIKFRTVESSSQSLQKAMLVAKIDLAICYLPIISDSLSYKTFLKDSFVIVPAVGSHLEDKIAKLGIRPGEKISPNLLDGEHLSCCAQDSYLARYLEEVVQTSQITSKIHHYVKSLSMLYSFASTGYSSVVLYKSYFTDSNILPYYFLDCNVKSDMTACLVWRKESNAEPFAKDLVDLINKISA